MSNRFGLLELAIIVLVAFGADRAFFAANGRYFVGAIELTLGVVLAAIVVVVRIRRAKGR